MIKLQFPSRILAVGAIQFPTGVTSVMRDLELNGHLGNDHAVHIILTLDRKLPRLRRFPKVLCLLAHSPLEVRRDTTMETETRTMLSGTTRELIVRFQNLMHSCLVLGPRGDTVQD